MSTGNDTSAIAELIPVRDHEGQEVASGRDLHAFLGMSSNYTTWFDRMVGYGFVEGKDYITLTGEVSSKNGKNLGGRPSIDHAVTFDMAKELGMIQRTPEGKRIREYFIEIEKKAREQSTVGALPSRAALAQMVLDAERELEAAKMQAELDAPKIRYHERFIAEMDDIITIEYFASHWGTTGPKVRQMLKDKKIAVRRCIGKKWDKSKGCMVDEFEWRPRQGTRYQEWFVVRPQHNAPRHHNGQVRQTMYLFSFHSEDLAAKLGLTQPVMFDGGDAA